MDIFCGLRLACPLVCSDDDEPGPRVFIAPDVVPVTAPVNGFCPAAMYASLSGFTSTVMLPSNDDKIAAFVCKLVKLRHAVWLFYFVKNKNFAQKMIFRSFFMQSYSTVLNGAIRL